MGLREAVGEGRQGWGLDRELQVLASGRLCGPEERRRCRTESGAFAAFEAEGGELVGHPLFRGRPPVIQRDHRTGNRVLNRQGMARFSQNSRHVISYERSVGLEVRGLSASPGVSYQVAIKPVAQASRLCRRRLKLAPTPKSSLEATGYHDTQAA